MLVGLDNMPSNADYCPVKKTLKRLAKETFIGILKRYIEGKNISNVEIEGEASAVLGDYLHDHPEYKMYEKQMYANVLQGIQVLLKRAQNSSKEELELYHKLLEIELTS